jgi:hypothetical protein
LEEANGMPEFADHEHAEKVHDMDEKKASTDHLERV